MFSSQKSVFSLEKCRQLDLRMNQLRFDSDLMLINQLVHLTQLDLSHNQRLIELDLRALTVLEKLFCSYNNTTRLFLHGHSLKHLQTSHNSKFSSSRFSPVFIFHFSSRKPKNWKTSMFSRFRRLWFSSTSVGKFCRRTKFFVQISGNVFLVQERISNFARMGSPRILVFRTFSRRSQSNQCFAVAVRTEKS